MSDSSSVLSDSTSEHEMFDSSLSVWRDKRPGSGTDEFKFKMEDEFEPLELDLHTQCCIGNYDNVREAVKNQSTELDRKNRGGWTPLMYACYTGHEAIVTLLIEAGVNLNMTNYKLITPLMLASSCGNEGIVRILVELGAHKDAVDQRGWSALFHATFSGQQVIVKFLLDCGVDMDLKEGTTGMTALMEAAQSGHEAIVQCFLDKGVDTKIKSRSGKTARTYAMFRAHSNIVSAIQQYNRKTETLKSKESPKSILKHTSALLEGPEAVKKLMKKLAFKDESPLEQRNQETIAPQQQKDTTSNNGTNNTLPPTLPASSTSTTTPQAAATRQTAAPPTLPQLLQQLGLSKYTPILQEQDVDLAIFLTLGDQDLKEIGINLLGPRKKMLTAINRWHNNNNFKNQNNIKSQTSSSGSVTPSSSGKSSSVTPSSSKGDLTDQEIRQLVLSLDARRQELESDLRREGQAREALEARLVQQRSQQQRMLVKAAELLQWCQHKSQLLHANLRKNIVVLDQSENASNHSVPISHLIGQDLTNQMMEGENSNQSNKDLLSLKKACEELESTHRMFLEQLSSLLLPALNNN